MSVQLMIELAWKSMLCASVALLALRLFRARAASEKSMIAHLGLLALLLLPLGVVGLPDLEFSAPASVAAMLPEAARVADGAIVEAVATEAAPVDWEALLLALYLVPAAALLLGLAIGVIRLHIIKARSEVLVDERWLMALARAQHRLAFKHGAALLRSGELNSPVSWGVVRPVIIVDPAAADDTARAEAIIAHELAHVVRLDWLKMLVGRLAVSLFWFNPLVWMLARQCHHLCEEATDDAVLRADIPSADYAELLLGAARHANRSALLPANGVAPGRSSLARRIAHVLDGSRPRGATRLGWAAASVAAALSVNGVIAAAEPIMATAGIAVFVNQAGERAADELDRIGNPHTRALAEAIRSRDWSRRGMKGPEGSTSFDVPAAVEPLLGALRDDDPRVRRIALWGLSEMRPTPGDRATGPVAVLLSDPDDAVRAQAARALGDFQATYQALQISRLLQDESPRVRMQAAHALGDLQNPASRPALEAAGADPDPAVRGKAAWALREVAEAEDMIPR